MPSRAATRSAMDAAAKASVPSGRWPPCCSTLPAATTATPLAAISPAAAGRRLPERLPDQCGQGGRVRHGRLPLGHRRQQRRLVERLGCRTAVAVRGQPGGQVADQRDHRDRRAERLGQARREFRRAGADRRVADASQPGDPGVGVGGVGGRALITHLHVRDARPTAEDAVVQRQRLAAGDAEDVPHPVLGEQPGQQPSPVPARPVITHPPGPPHSPSDRPRSPPAHPPSRTPPAGSRRPAAPGRAASPHR